MADNVKAPLKKLTLKRDVVRALDVRTGLQTGIKVSSPEPKPGSATTTIFNTTSLGDPASHTIITTIFH